MGLSSTCATTLCCPSVASFGDISFQGNEGRMFSGSYDLDDVIFLLKRVHIEPTPIAEMERLIQSGRHYSEMISAEHLPSPAYLRVFHGALQRQKARFARHLFALACRIATIHAAEVTLVSL